MTEAELQISLMTQQQPAQPAQPTTASSSSCASASISISSSSSTLSTEQPDRRGGGGGERDVAGGALTRARERVAECLCELCEVTAAGL